ncbi:XRE family transcriptional regulator [Pseudomonas fulva]|nr:XRE family transcriptional regulator [Pseudomonas fulva]UQY32989.1 XRE family transcriptional regulator [Pseudomonas fulva]
MHNIEHGKSAISLEKLDEVAAAVGVDPIAFLVIASAVSRSTTPESVIQLALEDLKAFQDAGGMERLAEQVDLGPSQVRALNRQAKIEAVRACKARGLSRREAAEELAMPKSTVASFWNS